MTVVIAPSFRQLICYSLAYYIVTEKLSNYVNERVRYIVYVILFHILPTGYNFCCECKYFGMASSSRGIQIGSAWFQRKINLRPQHRGVHLVTEEILKQIPEISQFSVGLCHIQILHTSASLAINESWDPNVRDDMEMMLNKIVPEGLPYRHSCEGPDDMPAHVKACFLGSSITVPITEGKLNLGTWQGIWLCEHRNQAGSRKLVITLNGSPNSSASDCNRSPMSPSSPMASLSS